MSIVKNQTGILAFVPDRWSDIWQSRHHVLSGLSEYYKVLWVSQPIYWQMWRYWSSKKFISDKAVEKVSDSLWTYASRLPADYKPQYSKDGLITDGFRLYHNIWEKRYISKIKKKLREMEVKKVILYIWRPEYHWALGKFGEILSCYHIDDDYGFSPEQDVPTSSHELKLIKESNLVFIHSRSLMAKKGNINPTTYYIPNGVDFKRYHQVMQSDSPLPDDIATIPEPRIGYVGYIKRHINLPLLLSLARKNRSFSIVMIGPIRYEHTEIKEDIIELKHEHNVFFLGSKSQTEIPHYIKALDVCLMPYRKTNYTKYIYPMKLHEYIACGKPVVATPLINLKEFSNVIYFAKSNTEWRDVIHKVLKSNNDDVRRARIEIARENNWQSRIDNIKKYFEKFVQI